jgi:outer membrane phospholipase A
MKRPALLLLLPLAMATLAFAAVARAGEEELGPEPIKFFERYRPSFFLLGEPNTKAQISFKVHAFRGLPLYFGYTQLIIWDLFKESAPIRDVNFDPEIFYRLNIARDESGAKDLDLIFYEHESNGRDGPASRSWNRAGVRYIDTLRGPDQRLWWSLKAWLTYGTETKDEDIRKRRGIWEAELGLSNLFERLFDVNELVLRIYGGGRSRVNPVQGGQELTYREKVSSRKLLLPLYFQIFHGYGENLLDAGERRWGFRAGVGF